LGPDSHRAAGARRGWRGEGGSARPNLAGAGREKARGETFYSREEDEEAGSSGGRPQQDPMVAAGNVGGRSEGERREDDGHEARAEGRPTDVDSNQLIFL
jgi:hypothetical protein